MVRVNLVKVGKIISDGLALLSEFDDSADHKIWIDIEVRFAQRDEHLKNR
ncbi:hypothetical protein ACU6U9_01480 [Pseudomonas sp. HK3]